MCKAPPWHCRFLLFRTYHGMKSGQFCMSGWEWFLPTEGTESRLQNQDFVHSQIGPAALTNSLIWRRDATPPPPLLRLYALLCGDRALCCLLHGRHLRGGYRNL